MSFKEVNPVINSYMQANPKNMIDGIMFVVLSVKTPFHTMYKQMEDYRAKGKESKYIWGWKKDTYDYLQENGEDLYNELMDLYQRKWGVGRGRADNPVRDRQMMLVLTDVPGLGLAKAGFVMQMMFGRVGCIDVHNLRRLRTVSVKDIQFTKLATDKTKLQKIENYVGICKHNNSTEKLWDKWCNLIAGKHCNHFDSGWDVSMYHAEALLGINRV
jgi:hypothetical protein